MAIKARSLLEGVEFEGHELTYIIDDELDVGEVYLDGTLLYQSDDVISERQLDAKFKHDFVIEDLPDSLLGIEDDKIDYNIDGVSTGLYTVGAEYITISGKEYIGDYHIHPEQGAMIGKFHDVSWTEKDIRRVMLEPVEDHETLMEARQHEAHRNIDYTVDEDVYPHIGGVQSPIELTDDELLEEQRKVANKKRFGIIDEPEDDKQDDNDDPYGSDEFDDL